MSYRVLHFEIQADDLSRAKDFYAKVFGWTFEDYSYVVNAPYWWVTTAPEGSTEPWINGWLMPRTAPLSQGSGANAFVATIGVDNYDMIEKKILENGGKTVQGKYALPGMAWQWYYSDTEWNIFGLHMPDEKAQ